jgi:hypothetical protein
VCHANTSVDPAGAHVVEQREVPGSGLAAVGAEVVVAVHGDDGPAELLGEFPAVLLLPVDAEPGAFPVAADAAIDDGTASHGKDYARLMLTFARSKVHASRT